MDDAVIYETLIRAQVAHAALNSVPFATQAKLGLPAMTDPRVRLVDPSF